VSDFNVFSMTEYSGMSRDQIVYNSIIFLLYFISTSPSVE